MAEPTTVNFPATLDTATQLGGDSVNIKAFVLNANIGTTDTSIPATATITGVNVPFYLLADSELIYVEGISGSSFTPVVRGAGGTTAASHNSGITLFVVYAANLFNQLKRAIIAIETELGITPIGPDGFSRSYRLVPSVSSSNLSLFIKDVNGNDPQPDNPVKFRVGNTVYTLTAATSFPKNAGTNWCNSGSAELATKLVQYFVYAIGETGASAGLKFGYSRIPYARVMGDFSSTSTSDKYIAGNWVNLNATDPVVVIGRFSATLSAGAGYTWSISGSGDVVNRPIYETDWLSYAGVVTSITGTLTSANGSGSVYKFIQDNLHLKPTANIVTLGTGATGINISNPWGISIARIDAGVGRENAVTGSPLWCFANTTKITILNYAGSFIGGDGYTLDCNIVVKV